MMGVKETENKYLVQYRREYEGLARTGPEWLREIRESAMRRFLELDFPTTRQEDWKYTNVSAIANGGFRLATGGAGAIDIEAARQLLPGGGDAVRLVFVDGHFSKALSSENLPGGAKAGSIAAFIGCVDGSAEAHLARTADYSNHAFTALNTAFVTDGAFIEIESGAVIDVPIFIVYISTGTGAAEAVSHPRSLIIAGHHSQATIVEQYIEVRSAECGMRNGGGEEKHADLGDREGGRKSGGRYF